MSVAALLSTGCAVALVVPEAIQECPVALKQIRLNRLCAAVRQPLCQT